jgi:hypothetical protein
VGLCHFPRLPASPYEVHHPISDVFNVCITVPEHQDNQKLGKWVDPESDEDTEDAVSLRMYVLLPMLQLSTPDRPFDTEEYLAMVALAAR